MALDFQFSILRPVSTTYRCELYHGAPYSKRELRGHIDPLETKAVTQSGTQFSASFASNPGNGYALRLMDAAGTVIARTNSRSLADSRRLLVSEITVQLTESQFGESSPASFQDGKTAFDHVVLDFVGEDLRVFGHAFHDGVINKRFNFQYHFQLKPATIPVWEPVSLDPNVDVEDTPEDTIIIDSTKLRIDADKNRQELLMGILHHAVKKHFRLGIQTRFHKAILAQANAQELIAVTLLRAGIEDGKLQFHAVVVRDLP
jgi:hypothetical protein